MKIKFKEDILLGVRDPIRPWRFIDIDLNQTIRLKPRSFMMME
jgi:hypothetical protein